MFEPVNAGPLLEREAEAEVLGAALVAAAAGRGGGVLVEGEAGIGKSSLLRVAEQAARDRGIGVLRASGGELEAGLVHGVVRQLFEPRLRASSAARRRELLEGAAAAAGPVVGFPPDGAATAGALAPRDASFAIEHGLYWLTAGLAEHGPLLLVVDDAHWADQASLRWLVFLARRLADLPVAVVVGVRSGDPGADVPALRSLREVLGTDAVEPVPLSLEAARRLVAAELGREVADDLATACHEASGGNPFLLQELARRMRADGDLRAATVEDATPARVSRSVLGRLGRLTPAAVALAESVAVLGADARQHHAAQLADLAPEAAVAALDALVRARLLAEGTPLRFVHPLVRTAVYAGIPRARRSAAHARAARLLAGEDPDRERAALQLLAADPAGDAWAVRCLRDAASRALSHGAPGPARDFLQRALAEPPPDDERGAALVELGTAEALVDVQAAVAHLREALRRDDLADDLRETATRRLAQLLTGTDEAVVLLETAIASTPDPDRERRLRLEADLAGIAQFSHDYSERIGRRLAAVPDSLPGETAAERVLLAALACDRLLRCAADGPTVAQLAERAIGGGRLLHEPTADSASYYLTIECLTYGDRLEAARAAAVAAVEDARLRGSRAGTSVSSAFVGRIALVAGDLPTARAELAAVLPALGEDRHPVTPWAAGMLALAHLRSGDAREAEAVLAGHGYLEGPLPPATFHTDLLLMRSELRLALGQADEATADALEALRRRALSGGRVPPVGWRLTAALALRATGGEDEARRLVDEEVALAEGWSVPASLGAALRTRAALTPDADAALTDLGDAVALLRRSSRRLELAQALVDHGAALRRSRRASASREPLREGLDLAHRCGARPLEERARTELLASGARPRRTALEGRDALTPSEQRVAGLAVEGLTNPQIAQALFVTRKTVESHLHAIYRKLAITSRRELATALESARE